VDESDKIKDDRARLFLAIEVSGPCALTEHRTIVRRMARRDPVGLAQAREHARTIPVGRTREWWTAEARRTGTDWPAILRQRTKVRGWVRAGRPPISGYARKRLARSPGAG
jgi:hypothetical protein